MHRERKGRRVLLLSALAACLSLTPAVAFEFFSGSARWPGAETVIHVGIPGSSDSGVPWSTAMTEAAGQWTGETRFDFIVREDFRDPCNGRPGSGDGFNGAGFNDEVCGSGFNSSTVAVTLLSSRRNPLGSTDLVETDIVFDASRDFDIFDGPQGNEEFTGLDFRRTVLHELGHVLGLGHESDALSIMAPSVGHLTSLQEDDIAGADFLYGGAANCENSSPGLGRVEGSLVSGDCRISDLMAGGDDDSLVDVYRLDISNDLTLTGRMSASPLDPVLVLTDPGLDILEIDSDSGQGCNARFERPLSAGSYLVLANTWTETPPCDEEVTGDYELILGYESDEMLTLDGKATFQGGNADAVFHGGVTTDGGETFRNHVSATQAFDVQARIEIDPAHQGQSGFIAMAAITDAGETLVLTPEREFRLYRPERELVPVTMRVDSLDSVESFNVLTDMVAADLGLERIEVDFLVGYGVDARPDELYFHLQPINLVVTPDGP